MMRFFRMSRPIDGAGDGKGLRRQVRMPWYAALLLIGLAVHCGGAERPAEVVFEKLLADGTVRIVITERQEPLPPHPMAATRAGVQLKAGTQPANTTRHFESTFLYLYSMEKITADGKKQIRGNFSIGDLDLGSGPIANVFLDVSCQPDGAVVVYKCLFGTNVIVLKPDKQGRYELAARGHNQLIVDSDLFTSRATGEPAICVSTARIDGLISDGTIRIDLGEITGTNHVQFVPAHGGDLSSWRRVDTTTRPTRP